MKRPKLEHITKFKPAFDKRNPTDPSKDYGIHCMECHMVVKGKEGAIHFIFSTGMFLPETMDEYARDGRLNPTLISPSRYYMLNKPMGIDVGYHSPKPMFDDQQPVWPTKMKKIGPEPLDIEFEKIGDAPPICEYIGVPCYCDGSALRADEWLNILLREGSDSIWEMLEDDYISRFIQ